ncbi:uncharacterized protein LOC110446756 [Mizuhopecten yessoensis]|uniref:uncharacterized protein LOC110446756 n=1 Tax=Mizuhopecten yessoensis TaxID=6573 RepID=UPI000B45DD9A|nr:uncharacterized protein LOC110446756 [Mizuhopecten yessoensis]
MEEKKSFGLKALQYSYADNLQLSRTTEDGCYSADFANDPGNDVYSVPLVQTEEIEEKKSSGLKALQRSHEDTITSISMTMSSDLDIEQRKTRHRRKSKSKWKKIYNRLRGGAFLKCIPFKNHEQEICEPMVNTRCKILADKKTQLHCRQNMTEKTDRQTVKQTNCFMKSRMLKRTYMYYRTYRCQI